MTPRSADRRYMQLCIKLARQGGSAVSPNPLVGAVLVRDGEILGRGFHEIYGGPHAEVRAIQNALCRGHRLTGACLYVSLEPCVHFGKTAPCVDTIIEHGIGEVVFGMTDPNPLVTGRSGEILEANGISTRGGVLGDACSRLNERYATWVNKKRPFVAIKSAQSQDGFITSPHQRGRNITSRPSRVFVHELRSQYDAILVGAGTVIVDNPELTVRHVKGRNPLRIVVDGLLRTPLSSAVYTDACRVLTTVYADARQEVFHKEKIHILVDRGVQVVLLEARDGRIPVANILEDLRNKYVASVFVEGGAQMYDEFLKAKVVDKMYVFTASCRLRSGLQGVHVGHLGARAQLQMRRIGDDHLIEASIVGGRP